MGAAKDRGEAELDAKGRLQLSLGDRERYGHRFFVVRTGRGLWLVPVPGDPLKELERIGRALPSDLTLEDLKQGIEDQAWADIQAKLARREARERKRDR